MRLLSLTTDQGRWIELRDTEQGKVMVDLSWLPVTGDREIIRCENKLIQINDVTY